MRTPIVVTLWICLAAAPSLAAGGGDEAGGGLLFPILNFVLLIAVLVYFARKPALAFFGERRDRIQGDLRSAAELKKQAEERYAKWQRRLADLETELASIRETSRERATTEREHILADARASAERIRRDASTAIEQELRRARARLREEASDLAVELAAGILREQVTEADRDRLLDEFVARVESSATDGDGARR
jgi:F-type H+-transporting ATPase subunit b